MSVNIPSSSPLFPSLSPSLPFSGFGAVSSLSGAITPATLDAELFTEAGLTQHLGVGRDNWFMVVLKELLEDTMDACEIGGLNSPDIQIKITDTTVSIADNGPGLYATALPECFSASFKSTSKWPYLTLSRGQNGKTLKSLLAAGLLVHGQFSCVHVESCGQRHVIEVCYGVNADGPVFIHAVQESDITTGRKVTFFYPPSARSLFYSGENNCSPLWELLDTFSAFNPHVRIVLLEPPEHWEISSGLKAPFPKWRPHDCPSAHWYSNEQFRQLVGDVVHRRKWETVADFVSRFHGLSDSTLQAHAIDMARLDDETHLRDLCEVNYRFNLELLLTALKTNGELVVPEQLGILGQDHFETWLEGFGSFVSDSYEYFCIKGFDANNLPYVLEVGIARSSSGLSSITAGTNFTCHIDNPILELEDMLDACGISELSSTSLIIHFAYPRVDFVDHCKTRVVLPTDVLLRLNESLTLVAKQWRADTVGASE